MRKLIVISTEDSNKIDSWSNVPYLFCNTLRDYGYNIIPFTINENFFLKYIIYIVKKILHILFKINTTWDYSRSALHYYHAQNQINKFCKKNQHDAVLVLSLSYGPSNYYNKPLILFGDWSYSYYLHIKQKKYINKFEKESAKREDLLIKKADIVITHFNDARLYIENISPKTKSFYLGTFINSIENPSHEDISIKKHSKKILFIGKSHYIEGARELIEAYSALKNIDSEFTLDIIGINKSELNKIPTGVYCHGYLSKGDDIQRKKYYSLLRTSTIFVNSNPKISSFSATLEAMYFFTPIIVTKSLEMVNTFGESISFGYYFDRKNTSLKNSILELRNSNSYFQKAINANHEANKYSWDNYIKKFTNVLDLF